MAPTIISRKHGSGLRVWNVNERSIHRIMFYRAGQVVLTTTSSWIERENAYPKDVDGLTLTHTVRRANKLDLSKGGHFYINSGKTDLVAGKTVDLYVDLDLDCEISDERVVEWYRTNTGVTYHKVRSLTAVFGADGKDTIDIVVPGSYFEDKNGYGEMMAAIRAHMQDKGMVGMSGIEAIIKDKQLLDMLVKAHELIQSA